MHKRMIAGPLYEGITRIVGFENTIRRWWNVWCCRKSQGAVREAPARLAQWALDHASDAAHAAVEVAAQLAGMQQAFDGTVQEKNGADAKLAEMEKGLEGAVAARNEAMAAYGATTEADRKSTRLNSSHTDISRMPSSA